MIMLRNVKFSSDGKYQYTCGIIHHTYRDDIIIFRDESPTFEVLEFNLPFDGCCSIVKIATDKPIDFDSSFTYEDGVLSAGIIDRLKPSCYRLRLDNKSNYIPVIGLKVISRGVWYPAFDR